MSSTERSDFRTPFMVTPSFPAWAQSLVGTAAFLVPGVALWLTSGYSWGAVLLLVGALIQAPRWLRIQPDRQTLWLAAAFTLMGLLWILLSDPREGLGQWDRPVKFALALPCLFFAARCTTSPHPLWLGLIAGSLGAGGIAVWQVFGLGLWRANGTTNAIQYGNLSLLLGAMLAVMSIAALPSLSKRHARQPFGIALLVVLAVAAGFLGSILSLSRGGWLALLLALPVAGWLMGRRQLLLMGLLAGLFAAALGLVALSKPEMLTERWTRTVTEVTQYEQEGGDASSIGQRLEHWRLAWNMGMEKPLLGWGLVPYVEEKDARVAAGLYRQSILEYKHAHNEVLDVFVKTGLVGVAVLLFFYAVPLLLFWPGRPPGSAPTEDTELAALRQQERAVQLAGVTLVVLYIGFGLTQVFFAHNSGIMFYLFMNLLLWSCLLHTRRAIAAHPHNAATTTTNPVLRS